MYKYNIGQLFWNLTLVLVLYCYCGAGTWDPPPGTFQLESETLYVGAGTQYLYVERGSHT